VESRAYLDSALGARLFEEDPIYLGVCSTDLPVIGCISQGLDLSWFSLKWKGPPYFFLTRDTRDPKS
jgi:hypothetical protein